MNTRRFPLLFLALLLSLTPPSVTAAETEKRPTLTLSGAKAVATAAVDYAKDKTAPGGAVAVVDAAGFLLYLEKLDGTFPAASDISIGKARTAAHFRKATRDFEKIINEGRHAMLDVAAVTFFTPLQGGVPITRGGEIVGAIGVSGAASAQQDDEIATAGATAFAAMPQSMSSVIHIPAERVAAAFREDANLVSTEGFRVNASHRRGAGDAEVHLDETDIFYILEGKATFVTGGTVSDARKVSPAEIRGTGIDGGTEMRLARGDVIVIPSGVPHWFKSVEIPFNYYVVKSTQGDVASRALPANKEISDAFAKTASDAGRCAQRAAGDRGRLRRTGNCTRSGS